MIPQGYHRLALINARGTSCWEAHGCSVEINSLLQRVSLKQGRQHFSWNRYLDLHVGGYNPSPLQFNIVFETSSSVCACVQSEAFSLFLALRKKGLVTVFDTTKESQHYSRECGEVFHRNHFITLWSFRLKGTRNLVNQVTSCTQLISIDDKERKKEGFEFGHKRKTSTAPTILDRIKWNSKPPPPPPPIKDEAAQKPKRAIFPSLNIPASHSNGWTGSSMNWRLIMHFEKICPH